MESWLRPVASPSDMLSRFIAAVPPENTDAEANVRWGKASPIEFLPPPPGQGFLGRTPVINLGVNFPDQAPDEEEEKEKTDEDAPVYVFQEYCRKTHKKRISNPEDDAQYVDVEVIDKIVFVAPNGDYWRFELKNP